MRTVSLCLLSAALLTAPAASARAATILDLLPHYNGPAHSPTDPAFEDTSVSIDVANIQPNGHFNLLTSGFSIPGKVSNKGKVTVVGKVKGTQGMQTFDAKIEIHGQLSATGLFMTGSVKIKGTVNGSPVNVFANFEATGAGDMMLAPKGQKSELPLLH